MMQRVMPLFTFTPPSKAIRVLFGQWLAIFSLCLCSTQGVSEAAEKWGAAIRSEDGRRIEVICLEAHQGSCEKGQIRFVEKDDLTIAGLTGAFSPCQGDDCLLTRVSRSLLSCDHCYPDLFQLRAHRPDRGAQSHTPDVTLPNRLFHQVGTSLQKAFPAHPLLSRWEKALNADFLISPELTCLPDLPRKQIGRGITFEQGGKTLSLKCLDWECTQAALLLRSNDAHCDIQIGSAFPLNLGSQRELRSSIEEAISHRYHASELIDLRQAFSMHPELGTFQWDPLPQDLISLLMSEEALKAILERQVRLWQMKPLSVSRHELNRWLFIFADAPYLHSEHPDHCRMGRMHFQRDDRLMSRAVPVSLSGISQLGSLLTKTNGSWTEAESNLFQLIVRPAFQRWLSWEASSFFIYDPRKSPEDVLALEMAIPRNSRIFKMFYLATQGDLKVSGDRQVRLDGRDLPTEISRIARQLNCD